MEGGGTVFFGDSVGIKTSSKTSTWFVMMAMSDFAQNGSFKMNSLAMK